MKRVASLLLLVAGCVTVPLSGGARHTSTWKGQVEWPDEHSAKLVAQPMEAGAAIAAAAAVREMVRRNPFPRLFEGCSSPEQGLDVAIFTGPTPGLYYVVLHQRFNRCGGPSGRVLDWWYEYAVTPQGEVVAEAPLPPGEAPVDAPLPSEQTPPPDAPSPSNAADAPAPMPPPAEAPPPASEAQPSQPGPEAPSPPAEVRP